MQYDAVVVGSGPNGFAAAITLARSNHRVLLIEAAETLGGGMATQNLTDPGFLHDVCSAVHPLAVSSPFFRDLPLNQYGLEWIWSPASVAHPYSDGSVALMKRSVDETASFFHEDAEAYRKLFNPLVKEWSKLSDFLLGPPLSIPSHPIAAAMFGVKAIRSCKSFVEGRFKTEKARAFFSGLSAHSIIPLTYAGSAAFGLILGALGHTTGWPIPKGGSQMIAKALTEYFLSLGGEVAANTRIRALSDLPSAKAYIFDVTPPQLLEIAGDKLSLRYRSRLENFRFGPAVYKMDWALRVPIPWKNTDCLQAATVHIGENYSSILLSEEEAWTGQISKTPFILLSQPSVFDPTRAPDGQHTAWAYCHVPHGSNPDMSLIIEDEIEKVAPGFRSVVIKKRITTAKDFQNHNPNLVGGDIGGGANTLGQILGRPIFSLNPYKTSAKNIYICSASTPPGGGVHGMCGFHAAKAVIKAL